MLQEAGLGSTRVLLLQHPEGLLMHLATWTPRTNGILFNFRLLLADGEVLCAATHFIQRLTLPTGHFMRGLSLFIRLIGLFVEVPLP